MADEYLGVRRQSDELRQALGDAQSANHDRLNTEIEQIGRRLGALQEMAFSREEVDRLRDWLVDSARKADCRVRQVSIGDERRRVWYEEDNPFAEFFQDEDGRQTPFDLVSRDITLAVSGGVDDVRAFLDTMDRIDRLIHVRQLDIRRADEEHGVISLQVVLVLYDLEQRPEDDDEGPDAPGPDSDEEFL
jgi:hypothetical protein